LRLIKSGIRGVPEGVGFGHGVEDDEQLSHASDLDDLEGFAGSGEPLRECIRC